jgi:hypothetical protein
MELAPLMARSAGSVMVMAVLAGGEAANKVAVKVMAPLDEKLEILAGNEAPGSLLEKVAGSL